MPKPLAVAARRLRRGEPAPAEPKRVRVRPPRTPRRLRPTIVEFLSSFGDAFEGESWDRWRIVLSAIYGLPLDPEGVEFFREVTGRTAYEPPEGGWREVAIITGARSGKTSIASAIAAYEAAHPVPGSLPKMGDAYSVMTAQDQRSAVRTLLNYARSPFVEGGPLGAMVESDLGEVLTLRNRVRIAAYPCRPAAVRGLTAVVAIADELAFFISTDGNPTDLEMLRALRTRVLTTGGKVVLLSSPYGDSGALYEVHKQCFGRDDASTLVIQAAAPMLNPTLPADYLAKLEQDDPETFRSEVLGEFRKGVSRLLDPAALEACVDKGIAGRSPSDLVSRYVGFIDAASGGGSDRFSCAVAHRERRGGVEAGVLDPVRCLAPPVDPHQVIQEAGAML